MKEKIALRVVNNLAFGNENMRAVLGFVYQEGKQIVDAWPDDARERLTRKLLQASGCLIRRKIEADEYLVMGSAYWRSEKGEHLNNALEKHLKEIESRRKG